MLIHHFLTPELSINSYLIYDEDKKVGALVDPSRNISDYLMFAKQNQIEITDILETHVHADFISGAYELKQALGGLPKIRCSGMGGGKWIPDYADVVVSDAHEFFLGHIRLKALHTPGHTLEHIIWLAYENTPLESLEAVFTGDLLFLGSVGRPDLLGPDAAQELSKLLYHSLFKVIYELPNSAKVYPSHGAGSLCGKKINPGVFSTIGLEKLNNPGMVFQSFENWKQSLMDGMPQVPQYFTVMKERNLKGLKTADIVLKPLNKDLIDKELSLNIAVDIRDSSTFAYGAFNKSINIPFGPSFALWAGSVLNPEQQILLVADSYNTVQMAFQALRLIGFDKNVLAYIALWEFEENERSRYLHSKPMIDVKTLFEDQKDYYILDVRTIKEWDAGHIEGAHLIPLTDMPKQIHKIPNDKPIAVICHSGNRASIAASLISMDSKVAGINVKGGMQAWINQKLPILRTGSK